MKRYMDGFDPYQAFLVSGSSRSNGLNRGEIITEGIKNLKMEQDTTGGSNQAAYGILSSVSQALTKIEQQ